MKKLLLMLVVVTGFGCASNKYVPVEPVLPEVDTSSYNLGNDSIEIPIFTMPPQYPRKAIMVGQEGVAQVLISINPDGTVNGEKVLAEAPAGFGFGKQAMRSVKKWKFKPSNDLYQNKQFTYIVEFKLDL